MKMVRGNEGDDQLLASIEVQELLPSPIVSDESFVYFSMTTIVSRLQRFLNVFLKMLKLCLPMGASYTFSFNILLLQILAGYLEEDSNGKTANLGAAALISSLLNALGLVAIGHIYSISIYTGKKRGRLNLLIKRNAQNSSVEEAAEIVELKSTISTVPRNGVLTSVMLPVAMVIMYRSQDFLILLGQNPENARLVQTYMRPAMGILPSLVLRMCFEQVLFGFEKQTPAMIIGLINFTIGLFLSVSLCFGKFSFPKFGLAGVAYGFLVESFLTCTGFGLYLFYHPDFKDYHFFNQLKVSMADWRQIKSLLKIGLPILFTLINEIIGELFVSLFSGLFGRDEIAARNFGALLIFMLMVPIISSGQAACQELSRLLGGKNFQYANEFARGALLSSLMIIAPLSLTAVISPKLLTNTVADTENINDTVLSLAKKFVPVTVLGMFGDAARYNMLQVLRASDDNIITSMISTATQWLGVGLAYLLGFKTGLGLYGLVIGDALGKWAGALSLFPRWYKGLQPDVLEAKNFKLPFGVSFRFNKTERQPLIAGFKEENKPRSWLGFFGSIFQKREKVASIDLSC